MAEWSNCREKKKVSSPIISFKVLCNCNICLFCLYSLFCFLFALLSFLFLFALRVSILQLFPFNSGFVRRNPMFDVFVSHTFFRFCLLFLSSFYYISRNHSFLFFAFLLFSICSFVLLFYSFVFILQYLTFINPLCCTPKRRKLFVSLKFNQDYLRRAM